jgi:hypothetical protein
MSRLVPVRLVPPAPSRPVLDYVPAPVGARQAIDSLAVNVRRVQAVLSGSFVTGVMLEEARRLAVQIAAEAATLPEVLG